MPAKSTRTGTSSKVAALGARVRQAVTKATKTKKQKKEEAKAAKPLRPKVEAYEAKKAESRATRDAKRVEDAAPKRVPKTGSKAYAAQRGGEKAAAKLRSEERNNKGGFFQ